MSTKFRQAGDMIDRVIFEIEKVIIGKREIVELLTICMAAGGHILIEDIPGVGKTTIAIALSKASNLEYKRVQFTPDTMPSDITGFNMYNREKNEFEYRAGVTLCNLLLADEINRAVPKTQSSLLEIMEEGSVTVDGITHFAQKPFMVIATQNPIGFIGTHTLPEAQLDRFLMKVSVGYPSVDEEIEIISNRQIENPLDSLNGIIGRENILNIQNICKEVFLDESIKRYIVNIVSKTRQHNQIKLGASPRASIALMRCSQASALLEKRDYVIPEDVAKMAVYVLSHRIVLNSEMKFERISVEDVIHQLIKDISIPYFSKKGRI